MDRNPLRRRRVALLTALILLAVLAISFYTRPRSLEDLGLPPAQCQRIQVWLNNVDNGDTQTLVLTPEDPAWSALLGLLETGTFHRSLGVLGLMSPRRRIGSTAGDSTSFLMRLLCPTELLAPVLCSI